MTDSSDFARLAELLISRQDQQQQQLDRLTVLEERQAEVNQRLDAGLQEARQTNRRLESSLAKTDEVLATFGQVQLRMLEELEKLTGFARRQEKFNERQEKLNAQMLKFMERQDQFNIIFLDEIREMRKDLRALSEVVMTQHEGRLKRLEDFMDGLRNAA